MAWPASTTTTANLNLRSSPTTVASVITVMPRGGGIQVTGPAQNGWFPVSYNGTSGWASAQYITPPPTGGTGTTDGGTTNPTPYGTSTTKTPGTVLNLRSGAGLENNILGTIPHGSSLTITGPAQNGWLPVTYNGKTGYVSSQYVNPFTPNAGTGTTPPPGTSPAPPPPPQSVPAGQTQNPTYDPGSTYGGSQNWYETPIVKQAQEFDSEWEKSITQQGFGGFGTKANIARGLVDRAKSGFGAATMNNPNLDPRTYINEHLGPEFLRSTMAGMTPMQRGEMSGIFKPRARWNER